MLLPPAPKGSLTGAQLAGALTAVASSSGLSRVALATGPWIYVWAGGSGPATGQLLYAVQAGSTIGSSVTCLTLSSDGTRLAAGTSDGMMHLYDVSARPPSPPPDSPVAPPLIELIMPYGSVLPTSVALSANGAVMVVGSGNLVMVWQMYGTRMLPRFQMAGHTGTVRWAVTPPIVP